MQINEDRDIRAYITKRTCISVIFSASFFTLIMGKFSIWIFPAAERFFNVWDRIFLTWMCND